MGHYRAEMYSVYSDPKYALPYEQERKKEIFETIQENPLSINQLEKGSSLVFYSGLSEPSNIRITPSELPETAIINNLYLVFSNDLSYMGSRFKINRYVKQLRKPLNELEFIVKDINLKEKTVCLGSHSYPFSQKNTAWYDIAFFEVNN